MGPSHFCRRKVLISALILALSGWTGDALAQPAGWFYDAKWLAAGAMHNLYQAGGGKPEVGGTWGLKWQSWYPNTDNQNGKGLWLLTRGWTDENGTEHSIMGAHVGPRYPGQDQMFGQEIELISRFERPRVFVDGFESFGDFYEVDRVNPDMNAAQMMRTVTNSSIGLTLKREVRAFSNKYHDEYHIYEWTFENTGNVDGDAEIELPNQTLDPVYIGWVTKYQVNHEAGSYPISGAGWGRNRLSDVAVDGGAEEPYDYPVDFRAAHFSWFGTLPSFTRWNAIGAPAMDESVGLAPEGDTTGRLIAGHMTGYATLHQDASATDESNDPAKVSSVGTFDPGGAQYFVEGPMGETRYETEWDLLSAGDRYPHQADRVAPPDPSYPGWHERMATASEDPFTVGLDIHHTGFGPYTLEPGEDVRIVIVEGVAGMPREAAMAIGEGYKDAWEHGNEQQAIPYDADGSGQIESDERMNKDLWVMTTRDSLFKALERGRANYESGYEVPQAPLPPREFRVRSLPDRIELTWQPYGNADPQGWELYRGRHNYFGAVEDDYQYELIAELDPGTTRFEDTEVARGVDYYYYLQAVGEVNSDSTGMTPTGVRLRSNRTFTQTYDPAQLQRPPGTVDGAKIVPNPYNLASDNTVRYAQQDRIAFLNIPGECTIEIYTEVGELIKTIEHTDQSGDEFWDLTTSSNQVVVSGLYMAVIKDHASGDQAVKKFVIIR